MNQNKFLLHLFIVGNLFYFPSLGFAQLSDEMREQRERAMEDRMQDLEDQRTLTDKPKTAEEVFELLKKKAELRIKEKRKQLLLKTKISAGLTYGYATNPQSLQNTQEKGDYMLEENFSFKWTPTFHDRLSADIGYSFYEQNYSQFESIDSEDHTISAGLKYYATKNGKLVLEPVVKYEWLLYPFDSSSSFEAVKTALRFTYYLNNFWSYGGEYEWSSKSYDKKAARDTSGSNTASHREDLKDSFELWLKKNIATYYSIKLKEKSQFVDSNDDYQDYNDSESHRGYITLAGSILKNRKLYLSYTADYEFKQYRNRLAVTTARADRTTQHGIYAYYPLTKYLSVSYTFNWKEASSNAATGELKDVSHKVGLTLNF